jgi:hypothetical protein
MKKVRKLNEAEENVNGIKASDLWVVQTYPGSDPYYIFTKKEDADIERDRYAKEYYDYYRSVNKNMSDEDFKDYFKVAMDRIKVVTLDDAIDDKVSEAIDNATTHDENY